MASLFTLFSSCDIRKEDKKAAPLLVNKTKKGQKPTEPPTTVEVLDSMFDFGKVNEGEVVHVKFRFKNTGTNPLVIAEALASCGCTVAEKPEAPVMPGDTASIKASFNTDKKPGEAHKNITVTSNAEPEFPQLVIKGTVIGKSE